MKHPEYDSPFDLVMSGIATQTAKNIDEMCWQAVQRVGINVDKEKLLVALKQDAERYREAYKNGYDTGYEKRDDDIVRCKDCRFLNYYFVECDKGHDPRPPYDKWFCADGKRRDEDA